MTSPQSGTRGRFVASTPPAPVPEPRDIPEPVEQEPVEDKSNLKGANAAQEEAEGKGNSDSDSDVVRATGSMAVATLLSRITGFVRSVLVTATLALGVSDAYLAANQLPNLVTEIVLGAVLTSLVVPVLVRAEREDPDRGEEFIRRLFTLAFSLLAVVTLVSVVGAPLLTRIFLDSNGEVSITQATSMAYLLLPQIFFYGLFALFQAVLNTKGIFAPGAWAPVINNIITIAVFLLYHFVPGSLTPESPSPVTDPHILLVSAGTTLGVVVQCLIMAPYLRRANINLKPLWGLDARLKQFGGMALAIIAYVGISQAGYAIANRVASQADKGAIAIYQNSWLLLQVPYGVIGVTLLTAIMPRLSRNAAGGDVKGVVRDLTLATKLTFIALIPIVIFMTGFGVPIARTLFQFGEFGTESAGILGLTLSFSAFTLIPYALVLLHLRVFYAREEAWTPTFIIAGITFTKVVLSLLAPMVASSTSHVVIILGAANGFGFVAGAVIGAFLLKRKLGSLGGSAVTETTLWATGAGLAGLVVAGALNFLLDLILPDPMGPLLMVLHLVIVGVVFVIATGLVLSRSSLPEVQNLAQALRRIPGMSRIIREPSEAIEVEAPEMAEIQPMFGQDAFNSSPVPPPMSAGIVRGPRLVPGAPVSDGRFRLLRDHGSVTGARFWEAREQETGRRVALTFVDTTGQAPMAAATPAQSARSSAEVSRRTRKLSELGLDSVATGVEILSYRAGCLVVSDWVDGTPLKTVAEADNLDPKAVAHALAPLAHDTAAAHAAGHLMGLDNRNRIRISTEGVAILAFPAVLPGASANEDREGLSAAITQLVKSTDPTPQVLEEIADDAEETTTTGAGADPEADNHASGSTANATGIAAAARAKLRDGVDDDPDAEDPGERSLAVTLESIAERLSAFAPTPADEDDPDAAEPQALKVEADQVQSDDEPEATAGFGSRGYSGSGAALIGVTATIFVVIVAGLTAWVVSLLSQGSDQSPINPESVGHNEQQPTIATAPPILLGAKNASVLPGDKEAPELVDANAASSHTLSRNDDGIMVALNHPAQLRNLLFEGTGIRGVEYKVYGVHSEAFNPDDPQPQTKDKLAEGKLTGSSSDVKLDKKGTYYDAVVVEFSGLPDAQAGKADLAEVKVVGVNEDE